MRSPCQQPSRQCLHERLLRLKQRIRVDVVLLQLLKYRGCLRRRQGELPQMVLRVFAFAEDGRVALEVPSTFQELTAERVLPLLKEVPRVGSDVRAEGEYSGRVRRVKLALPRVLLVPKYYNPF